MKVKITADLKIKGIVNFNGSDPTDRRFKKYANGQEVKNHRHAKRDESGIDFTSSNCLRHCIFSAGMNLDSEDSEVQDRFASSHIGMLRGYMYADKKGTIKRPSCVSVLDAYSETICIFQETNNKAGEKTSTSFFSKDNANERVQKLEIIFDFDSASFISIAEQSFFCEPSVFQEMIESNFSGKGSKLFQRDMSNSGVALNSVGCASEGILLSNEQVIELFNVFMMNLKNLFRSTRGGRLEIDEHSILINLKGRLYKESELNLREMKLHCWEEKILEKPAVAKETKEVKAEKAKKDKKEKQDKKEGEENEAS